MRPCCRPIVGSRVAEEGKIPDLRAEDEVFGPCDLIGAQFPGKVVGRRTILHSHRVLAIELCEAVAELVMQASMPCRGAVRPEVMVARYCEEEFRLRRIAEASEELARGLTTCVVEVVSEERPEVELVRGDEPVHDSHQAIKDPEKAAVGAILPTRAHEAGVGEEETSDAAACSRNPQTQAMAAYIDRRAARCDMQELCVEGLGSPPAREGGLPGPTCICVDNLAPITDDADAHSVVAS
mmetsp:Transcript_127898/g.272757  ORF Transcript_127898/g.272757 Transcript_127898/m.272757 type:complete len:239 (+) Transcript_127898:984-1700(+)